jgi:hypothetical protein
VTEDQNAVKLVYTFVFDSGDRIIKKLYKGLGQLIDVTNTYTYDTSGNMVADSVFDNYWAKTVYWIASYTYDQNRNVIESNVVDTGSGTLLVQGQCTYDNDLNPLGDKTVMNYFLDSGYEFPAGKNNLLKEIFEGRTIVNYIYEYNSNGLPKKCSFVANNDPLVTYMDYYYE